MDAYVIMAIQCTAVTAIFLKTWILFLNASASTILLEIRLALRPCECWIRTQRAPSQPVPRPTRFKAKNCRCYPSPMPLSSTILAHLPRTSSHDNLPASPPSELRDLPMPQPRRRTCSFALMRTLLPQRVRSTALPAKNICQGLQR